MNGGTLWVLHNANDPGEAPQGEFGIISDSTAGGLISLRANLTAAIQVSDKYAIANNRVPLNVIISQLNASLLDMGIVPYTDITSLTITANKTEYTLPISAKRDLRQVWIQTDKNNVVSNQWEEILNWYRQGADPGSADTLVLPYQYNTGFALKLVYLAPHPELVYYSDVLSEYVPLERVIYPAILGCLKWRRNRTGWRDWDTMIARYEAKTTDALTMKRIPEIPRRSSRVNIFLSEKNTSDNTTVNRVYL